MDNLALFLPIFHYLGGDEEYVISNLSHIKLLFSFCLCLVLHTILCDNSLESVGFFMLSFFAAILFQEVAGHSMDVILSSSKLNRLRQTMPRTFAFSKWITQAAAFTVGNLICHHYQAKIRMMFGAENYNASPIEDQFCIQNSDDCRKQSLVDLGLTPEATFQQAKLQWHKLAKQLHPDVLPSTLSTTQKVVKQAEFTHLVQAYERLKLLNRRTQKL
jgi:hypothetical protein